MKAIWLALCAAVAALSFYPEYIVFNGNVYYFHAFWLSTAIVTRIVQVLFILSVLGWLRDLSKHKGQVIGRLMSRTFIMIGAVMALYIPWDEMTDADHRRRQGDLQAHRSIQAHHQAAQHHPNGT